MICPNCHGTTFDDISGQYETGVVAPDGYRESVFEWGARCRKCGATFDESECGNQLVKLTFTVTITALLAHLQQHVGSGKPLYSGAPLYLNDFIPEFDYESSEVQIKADLP